MRPESALWRRLRPILITAKLDPVRVENPIHPGTPDVNTILGWIELKSIAAWPSRETSLVQLKHFTSQQRVWLYRRWKYAPGTTHLLLEVRAEGQCLLFDGDIAAKVVGRASAARHLANARAVLSTRALAELPRILARVADRDDDDLQKEETCPGLSDTRSA